MSEGSGTLAPSTDNSTVSDLVHKGVIPTNHSGAVFIIESTTSLFSKAIIMMSRVGDNLYLVPTTEGLYLKAYNSSKTVCGGFLFRNEFFLYRDTTRLNVDRAQNVCRISMKCAISTFHQIGEKKPCNSLVLFLDPMGTHIKFIFYVNCGTF
ncbi:hypothetical protein L596_024868 [Steinernema carpocapsae]|uniref:Uncharacterized protein n=1 Tax=Steinernema carpocapsae TaxID=34508 RepID=A0A4U5M627_STECR|nr:hypothetical protein L596_024868 [Steinernema carpocapsae]